MKEAIQVFGADDAAHPAVAYLRNNVKDYYIGGKVQAIQAPTHFDYVALRCRSTVVPRRFVHLHVAWSVATAPEDTYLELT